MDRQGVHHRVHDFGGQGRGVGELGFGVVAGLDDQFLGLQEFSLDDIVHVNQLIIVRQVALEEIVDPGDDLGQQRLLLLLDAPRAGFRETGQPGV